MKKEKYFKNGDFVIGGGHGPMIVRTGYEGTPHPGKIMCEYKDEDDDAQFDWFDPKDLQLYTPVI